ncbi:Y+L amino acid transporter 1 isoform X1 [Patella vulgata]|uniref:Y+L amino acid transporter 1 isoform X1 n=2 Tax=Patella vulgata TaxID=6465 RepID=UPI0024A7A681|nr:Y+L amino acid transporter 1 isoform X1 [Patella vulgata]
MATTDDNHHHPSLKRQLGLVQATCYITGGIIGVGIFIGPATVLKGAGSSVGVSLSIWVVSGFLMYCGAMCYAEYGSRVPKSGGTYTYIREAFGELAGFVFLWTQLVLVRPLAVLLSCLASAEYIIRPVFLTCPDMAPTDAKILLGISILVITVAVNCYSVNYGAYYQTLATFCKVAALVVIIIGGFVHLAKGNTDHFDEPFKTNSEISPTSVSLTIYVCFYAYMGWDNVTVATEEVTNPKRNIPLAILFGLAISTVIYLSANVAYHAALTNSEIMSGVAVAVMFGERVLGPVRWIILPCVGISAAGISNAIIFTSSRINFVGGRDGLFPELFSMVNINKRTPMPSIITLGILAMIYMCIADFVTVLGAYSFLRAGGEAVAIFGFRRIRRKHPATEKTFVTPTIIPIIYSVASIALACVAVGSNPRSFLPGLIIALMGIPLYYLARTQWWRNGLPARLHNKLTKLCNAVLLCDIATKAINEE